MKLHLIATAFMAALLFTLPGTARAMPILIVENGELLGADNVDVNGALFDVRFRDGSCMSLFSGCDNASEDFPFMDAASAEAAAQALLDQVFLDGPEGLFDSNPALTLGCSAPRLCQAIVPYTLSFGNNSLDTMLVWNYARDTAGDLVTQYVTTASLDSSDREVAVFAVFTAAGSSVPVSEPGTLALLGLGLAGLGFARRRLKHAA